MYQAEDRRHCVVIFKQIILYVHDYHDNEATCKLLALICVIEVILRKVKMKKMLMMMLEMIITAILDSNDACAS